MEGRWRSAGPAPVLFQESVWAMVGTRVGEELRLEAIPVSQHASTWDSEAVLQLGADE